MSRPPSAGVTVRWVNVGDDAVARYLTVFARSGHEIELRWSEMQALVKALRSELPGLPASVSLPKYFFRTTNTAKLEVRRVELEDLWSQLLRWLEVDGRDVMQLSCIQQMLAQGVSQAAVGTGSKSVAPTTRQRDVSEADKAKLKIKVQRDKLQKCMKRSELAIECRKKDAKTLAAAGKKREAMLVLKLKKSIETQLQQTETQILQVEEMLSAISQAEVQAKVVEGISAGNEALKALQSQIGTAEQVQDLMDETADLSAYFEEVQEAISGSITEEDETDILAELEALERMEADELAIELPDAPVAAPVGVAVVDEPEPAATEPEHAPKRERTMVAA